MREAKIRKLDNLNYVLLRLKHLVTITFLAYTTNSLSTADLLLPNVHKKANLVIVIFWSWVAKGLRSPPRPYNIYKFYQRKKSIVFYVFSLWELVSLSVSAKHNEINQLHNVYRWFHYTPAYRKSQVFYRKISKNFIIF